MKITILQEHLSKVLNNVVKAVSSRPNIPVLANVLIKTEQGEIKLSTTNLEIGINAKIGAEIIEEGEVTVSAKLLSEFVNTLDGGKIELIQEGQTFYIKSKENNAEFFIIPVDEFPNVPQSSDKPIMTLEANKLADAISKTILATANDDSRPVLTGVLFEAKENNLSLVGVDGFRLSKVDLNIEEKLTEEFKEIIPAKSLQEVERIIRDVTSDKEDKVEIYMLGDKNQILFKVKHIEISSLLIEGEFPDYNQIIPKEKKNSFSILKSDLLNSTKVIMIFARNIIGYKTKFSLQATDRKLQLSTNVIDVGNNESAVDITNIEGESIETAYNCKFLIDMIGSMKGDEIIYETNGVTAPGVFRDKSDETYLHIIMPMRID